LKRKPTVMFVTAVIAAMGLVFAGCGKDNKTETVSQKAETVLNTAESLDKTEEATTEDEKTKEASDDIKKTLKMTMADTEVNVAWEDNESVQALKDLCGDALLTISMSMYGGFEQVGPLGTSIPSSDTQTTTQAGDIVLYSGNQIVVFYGSNAWAYTKLGHITDKSAAEMTTLLANGNVDITISLESD